MKIFSQHFKQTNEKISLNSTIESCSERINDSVESILHVFLLAAFDAPANERKELKS